MFFWFLVCFQITYSVDMQIGAVFSLLATSIFEMLADLVVKLRERVWENILELEFLVDYYSQVGWETRYSGS